MAEEPIVFESDDEARAWDAYAAMMLPCFEPDAAAGETIESSASESAAAADAMLRERRKRMRAIAERDRCHRSFLGEVRCGQPRGHIGGCQP